MSLAVDVIQAGATTAAVVVALYTGQRGREAQRAGLAADGRLSVALDIVQWAQSAETTILAYHNPDNWRVPPGMQFTAGEDRTGEIIPPSQGRIGPVIESAVKRFDEIRGSARLAFGPQHEVTELVEEVIVAIRQVARRGVIYAREDGPTPKEYVDLTFVPLVRDLVEALADACDLRGPGERSLRSGVRATDHMPGVKT